MRIEKEVLDILEARLANETRQGVDITDALIERIRGEILIEITTMRDALFDDLARISKEFVRGAEEDDSRRR